MTNSEASHSPKSKLYKKNQNISLKQHYAQHKVKRKPNSYLYFWVVTDTECDILKS